MKKAADEIKKLRNELKAKDEQIANLKKAPAVLDEEKPLDEGKEAYTAKDMFNLISNV